MTEAKEKALQILSTMLGEEMFGQLLKAGNTKQFAGRLNGLAMSNVFEPLWTSDVLDARTRSLITVGMLIALRATEEIELHAPAALRNGATVAELEEVIYHSTAYAGFPAAMSARRAAMGALKSAGLLS